MGGKEESGDENVARKRNKTMTGYLRSVSVAVRQSTGVVIPVFLPRNSDVTVSEPLVRDTVEALIREVEKPAMICLSVDGSNRGQSLAQKLSEDFGVSTVFSDRSRGKLSALRKGMQILLANSNLRYFATVDQDGDHFANELPNFLRAIQHVETSTSSDKALVLGRRISRHRPLGFKRGELEDLADRILLDSLYYRAATTGCPLPLQFAATLDEFPDFHSGYKLFTRPTASDVFTGEPQLCGVSEDCYYRHACEAVMTVEALENGACLTVVNRSTFDEQPISVFGSLDRQRLVADKIIWPCKRLEIPPAFVSQWLQNHLPRILLGTLLPEGREELLKIRDLILSAFGISPDAQEPDIIRMPFV